MKHHAILYLLLSPFDNEQLDLTHRFLEEKVVDQIPNYTYIILQNIFTIPIEVNNIDSIGNFSSCLLLMN